MTYNRARSLFMQGAVLGVVLLALVPSVAYADDGQANLYNVTSMYGVISLLVGTVLPIVVGFVTKESWNSGLKFFLLGALSALTALLTQYLDHVNTSTPFSWQSAILSSLVTLAVAEASYYKIWKSNPTVKKLQATGAGFSTSVEQVSDDQVNMIDPADVAAYNLVDEDLTHAGPPEDARGGHALIPDLAASEGGKHEA